MLLDHELAILINKALISNRMSIEQIKKSRTQSLILVMSFSDWIREAEDHAPFLNKLTFFELEGYIKMLEMPNPAEDTIVLRVNFNKII